MFTLSLGNSGRYGKGGGKRKYLLGSVRGGCCEWKIKWNIAALRTRGAVPLLENLRLHVGRLEVFMKCYEEAQLRLVNSALPSLTEAQAAGAPPPHPQPTHPPLVLNNAAALSMGHLFAYFLSSSFLFCHFFPETSQVAAAKRERQMAASRTGPSAAQRTVAAPGGLQGKEAAWDAARTLFRVMVGWGRGGGARERARSNLHMNTDGQGGKRMGAVPAFLCSWTHSSSKTLRFL